MTRTGTADGALLLDNQLCFLVYRLHRAITDVYRPVLADLGLTYPQYLVMLVMWESQPLTVSQLGERLQLDSGTLSPLLKRLEGAGLIERTRSTKDERSVEVWLTRQGKRLRESARKVPSMIGECLAASPDEYWDVREQLTSMLARVESAGSA